MKERPILFKGDMVRAILEDRKTETRRIFRKQPIGLFQKIVHTLGYPASLGWLWAGFGKKENPVFYKCPYGQIGDRLWVRETWAFLGGQQYNNKEIITIEYKDGTIINHTTKWQFGKNIRTNKWKPSIHMPRVISRINLEITEISVERVQDITEEGAKAEGVKSTAELTESRDDYYGLYAHEHFQNLWDLINKKRGYSWDSNPWVWVIKFRRTK